MKRVVLACICLVFGLLLAVVFVHRADAVTLDNVSVTSSKELAQEITTSDQYDLRYIIDRNFSPDHFYRVYTLRKDTVFHDTKGAASVTVKFTFPTSDLVTQPMVSSLRYSFRVWVKPNSTFGEADRTACYALSITGKVGAATTFTQPESWSNCDQNRMRAKQNEFVFPISNTLSINAPMDSLTFKVYAEGEAPGDRNVDPFVETEIKLFEIDPIDNQGPVMKILEPPSEVGVGQDYVARAYIQDPVNGLNQIQLFCQDKTGAQIPCWATIPAFTPGTTDKVLVEGRIRRQDEALTKNDVSYGLVATDLYGQQSCNQDWFPGCPTSSLVSDLKYYLFMPVSER